MLGGRVMLRFNYAEATSIATVMRQRTKDFGKCYHGAHKHLMTHLHSGYNEIYAFYDGTLPLHTDTVRKLHRLTDKESAQLMARLDVLYAYERAFVDTPYDDIDYRKRHAYKVAELLHNLGDGQC